MLKDIPKRDEVGREEGDDRVCAERLRAEHVGQHAVVMVQIDGEHFALKLRVVAKVRNSNKHNIFKSFQGVPPCLRVGMTLILGGPLSAQLSLSRNRIGWAARRILQ